MAVIITSECEHCVYGECFKVGRIEKIRCSYKEREYYYGQCVPCEHKQIRKEDIYDNESEQNSEISED